MITGALAPTAPPPPPPPPAALAAAASFRLSNVSLAALECASNIRREWSRPCAASCFASSLFPERYACRGG